MWYAKFTRRLTLAALARATPDGLLARGERRVLRAFRRAAAHVPAYRRILREHGIDPGRIRTLADFTAHCPILGKADTFGRFPLDELCGPGALGQLASVLTSSGQGGRFAFGLSTHRQARRAAHDIDLGLQHAFQVDDRRTLLINCLPMGVRFTSHAVTVAETSVREDMVVALVTGMGGHHEQIVLVGDPLFLKRLTDFARDQDVDWGAHRMHAVIGEEVFGEHYRDYLARELHIELDDPGAGLIGSSMGVAELGLNLFFETRETIALRRRAHADPEFFQTLFGYSPADGPLPMLFVYNPLRTGVEVPEPDALGYGALAISMLDPRTPLPLLRYRTGDVARLIPPAVVTTACGPDGSALTMPSLPLVAVAGREGDRLPDGTHLARYKDALFADHELAAALTGAVRLQHEDGELRIHVQLREARAQDAPPLAERLTAVLPGQPPADRIRLWPYHEFPFGMTLDYERKFSYLERP